MTPLISLLTLTAMASAADGPCANIFPNVFSVDPQGQVVVKGDAGVKYDLKRSTKEITLTGRGLQSQNGQVITIGLDEKGRAASVTETSQGAANQLVGFMSMGMFLSLRQTTTHLTYDGGACAVEKLTSRDKTVIDSRMCNELQTLFEANRQCKATCDNNIDAKSGQILAKYKVPWTEDGVKKELGVHFPLAGAAVGYQYLQRCANPIIKASMAMLKDKPSSAASPAGDAKTVQ